MLLISIKKYSYLLLKRFLPDNLFTLRILTPKTNIIKLQEKIE